MVLKSMKTDPPHGPVKPLWKDSNATHHPDICTYSQTGHNSWELSQPRRPSARGWIKSRCMNDICRKLDVTGSHHAELRKPDSERHHGEEPKSKALYTCEHVYICVLTGQETRKGTMRGRRHLQGCRTTGGARKQCQESRIRCWGGGTPAGGGTQGGTKEDTAS